MIECLHKLLKTSVFPWFPVAPFLKPLVVMPEVFQAAVRDGAGAEDRQRIDQYIMAMGHHLR
jgi:hypothetical protein